MSASQAGAIGEQALKNGDFNKNENSSTMAEKSEAPSLESLSDPSFEQDRASSETVATTPKTLGVLDLASHSFRPQSSCGGATFIRQKDGWAQKDPYRLKNSLLAGVGLLELANARDFAANVWNQIPVPQFAMALMALGGTLALTLSLFAFRDVFLSRENIRNLHAERRFLWAQKSDLGTNIARDLNSQLDTNFRELGTEYVDRLGMDIAMGFGAVMVGVVAFFGPVNAGFSVYVWRRAHRHGKAVAKVMNSAVFHWRIQRVKTHAGINAIMGVTAGAASMVTATHWEGYLVLIPCIISAIALNYMWRTRIGYERPLIRRRLEIDTDALIAELEHITSTREIFRREDPSEWFSKLILDPISLPSILQFLRINDMFDDFCLRLLSDP